MDLQDRYKPAKLYFKQYTPEVCDPGLPPILFLHGVCSLHTTWNPVWKKIADRTQRQVFSVELRNHGKSEWNDHLSVEHIVVDLEHFLSENGIKRCAIVGHSLGGRAGMYLALKKPELVERIVAEESKLEDITEDELRLCKVLFSQVKRIRSLPKCMSSFEIGKMLQNMVAARFPGNFFSSLACFVPVRRDSESDGFDFDFNVPTLESSLDDFFNNYNLHLEKVGEFRGPALFVYAEGTHLNVQEDKRIPEKFPNAEFYKFKIEGHVLHTEQQAEFVEKVSEFMNSAC